ncbi:nitrate reductase molybdenum cofactor assembly chaperone [Kingella negevensis]|uniref:Nitrate reductase molybdenum cofactor assembly chaperone NarJ n=1 Tax=Kingella negevensis TaxID=1522312 RepID=A0A238TBY0_9NEIS|nr:nitrate reductase molybdenum cofactor assembly chaperone [Kingella negevensis]MDK4680568.1 nitrate reductase molybdenum cofactor assembly chaperone [Kingella negevensis]MDK4681709.1 nitrate reductase molybdenum cofactor assembly chaperone [Kingella negevensis]MDK4685170.1 nitrate reductase molybdenum cofactor assembly chaperone [Kingella negevensis]MDK4689907.1 nitrate reductase molybdenum cofactor assembly chaperone [Kingella negevensis]MDK4692749.1 nitrate reductase molybdenum cofactor as
MDNNLVYKWFSALLCYPEADLIAALPEFQAALNDSKLLAEHRGNLQGFLNYLGNRSLRELQENYVSTFDRNRNHALYIFEHVYGEDRDRGSAMVDLLEEYRSHGFELGDDELPDYLPALLEYFSQIPEDHAQKLLGDAVHVINHIANKLSGSESPYAALLKAIVALSPVEPQPLIEPPVRDMDEAMETFGPDMSGTEPLLKPSIETVQFYPKGSLKTAQSGAKK